MLAFHAVWCHVSTQEPLCRQSQETSGYLTHQIYGILYEGALWRHQRMGLHQVHHLYHLLLDLPSWLDLWQMSLLLHLLAALLVIHQLQLLIPQLYSVPAHTLHHHYLLCKDRTDSLLLLRYSLVIGWEFTSSFVNLFKFKLLLFCDQ